MTSFDLRRLAANVFDQIIGVTALGITIIPLVLCIAQDSGLWLGLYPPMIFLAGWVAGHHKPPLKYYALVGPDNNITHARQYEKERGDKPNDAEAGPGWRWVILTEDRS